jgi:hypothetical protein
MTMLFDTIAIQCEICATPLPSCRKSLSLAHKRIGLVILSPFADIDVQTQKDTTACFGKTTCLRTVRAVSSMPSTSRGKCADACRHAPAVLRSVSLLATHRQA